MFMEFSYQTMLWILGGICFVNACFTAWLAAKKNYDREIWFFCGLCFGIIALLALGFAPPEPKKKSVNYDEKYAEKAES